MQNTYEIFKLTKNVQSDCQKGKPKSSKKQNIFNWPTRVVTKKRETCKNPPPPHLLYRSVRHVQSRITIQLLVGMTIKKLTAHSIRAGLLGRVSLLQIYWHATNCGKSTPFPPPPFVSLSWFTCCEMVMIGTICLFD